MFTTYQITGTALHRMYREYKNLVRAAVIFVLLVFGCSSIAEEQTVKRILETSSGAVEISILDGTGATTQISTGDLRRVVVESTITGFLSRKGGNRIRKRVEELLQNPPIEQEGNHVKVGGLPWRVRKDVSISYHITVPPNTNVHVSGPETVRVTGLHGNLHVYGANTIASNIRGNITLESAKCIRVTDLSGDLHVTGGRVVASDIKGDVLIKRAEYVAIDNVSGKLTVTDRAQAVNLDEVIVDLGTYDF